MSRAFLLSLLLLFAGMARAAGLDPTLPPPGLRPGAGADAPASLALQAILRSNGSSRAVIDGQTLRVNDLHGGARVLAIYPHAVLIERQGQRQLLHLAQPVVKPSR